MHMHMQRCHPPDPDPDPDPNTLTLPLILPLARCCSCSAASPPTPDPNPPEPIPNQVLLMQRCLTPDEKAKVLRLPQLRRALAAAPPPQPATPSRLAPLARQTPPLTSPPATTGAAAAAAAAGAGAAAAGAGAVDEGDAGEYRRLAMAYEYLGLVSAHPAPLPCVLFHLRRICKTLLSRYQAMDELLAAPG